MFHHVFCFDLSQEDKLAKSAILKFYEKQEEAPLNSEKSQACPDKSPVEIKLWTEDNN